MKVLDLRCGQGHGFEGWFASEDDFVRQHEQGLVECPLCGDKAIARLPSAPRLNLSGAKAPAQPQPPQQASSQAVTTTAANPSAAGLQALWMQAMREVIKNTEDVGTRFPEEARRIHYGETEARGIRGQATPEQRAELSEEGIDVLPLAIPDALKGPAH
ncbi:MAG TPA: DUF1178 family protein [Ideonella sp.]|nr:DUF1178 family protein [Ideonella sp.]